MTASEEDVGRNNLQRNFLECNYLYAYVYLTYMLACSLTHILLLFFN